MHALITGGAGFIGSHLAEALLEQGYRVTCIDNLSTGKIENVEHLGHHPDFALVVDSIRNQTVLDRLVQECDVIFHLAAAVGVELIVRDPVHAIETNVLGTHALLKSANRHRKKVLIASTSEIYGKSDRIPFREDDDTILGPTSKSRWSYSSSKAVDEFLALAYQRQTGLPTVIVRLFNTIGPRQTGQYGMVVPRFVAQALQSEKVTVYGDGKQTRCFCDVSDVVRAMIALVEKPNAIGTVYNLGSQSEITILELARKVLEVVDCYATRKASGRSIKSGGQLNETDSRIEFVAYEDAYEPGFEDMRRRVPDISRVEAAIGWEPVHTLDKSLRRIVESIESSARSSA